MQDWPLTEKGLEFDRQFMVVNAETKRFVTQRQVSQCTGLSACEISRENDAFFVFF